MSTRWYPIYQKGNPQLRIFLPNFWMKLVKPVDKQPPNIVQFIVPTGMSNHDIKNYLTKIYKVPVAEVRSSIVAGECRRWRPNSYVIKDDDFRRAFVTLERGHTFEFPNIAGDAMRDDRSEIKKIQEEAEKDKTGICSKVDSDRANVPPWFAF